MKKFNTKTLKIYFMVLNLMLSTIALGYLIDAQTDNMGGTTNTGTGQITNTGPNGITIIPTGGPGNNPTNNINPGTDTTISDIPGNTGGGDPPGDGGNPPGDDSGPGDGGGGGGDGGGGGGGWDFNWQSIVTKAGLGATIFGTIGSLAGGDDGMLWGSISGAIGGVVAGLLEPWLGETWSMILGLGVATVIFLLTYKKKSKEIVEFHCLPWQAPIGGDDCQICNNYKECSEYTCKSLGQACEIVNSGTAEQKCIWKNPHDVNSPSIKMEKVSKGHKYLPDTAIRPPATGVKISLENGNCIKPYTPLEFKFSTDEPAQCKIDYNLTSDIKTAFDEMTFYVGGDSLFVYNHSEKMALPGPAALNAIAPELKNNGEYTLFVRCKDANGNFNQDPFSISFCVDKGPDTTPPIIESINIPTGKPIQFNRSKLDIEVYVNEPSECKWSRVDTSYDNMENIMDCNPNVWIMNNNNVYTCITTLTGIESRKENYYYFKCKDQPWAQEGDRNVNSQSYEYKVIGTQPLNIIKVSPEGTTIRGATDTIPVFLEIQTDNGYKNGDALCYYSSIKPEKEEDYILFLDTNNNVHKQRQDLVGGSYTYYFKCIDLGGNTIYNSTSFIVESDKVEPMVARAYKESSELKVLTDEPADCSYSTKDCNYEIDSGTKMITLDNKIHSSEWVSSRTYYVRCKDKYNNQPNPNTCSIILKPTNIENKKEQSGEWTFQF